MQDVRSAIAQIPGHPRHHVVRFGILITDDRRALRRLHDIGPGHARDRWVLLELLDQGGQRRDSMVEAKVVVGEQKDKFTFRQPEYL